MSDTPQPRFSFMSANLLAREKGYQKISGFGEGNKLVTEAFAPAATYPEKIDRLFGEIAEMGFRAVDLWTAHCNPQWTTPQHLDGLQEARAKHGLEIVSLAGGLPADLEAIEATVRLAADIGCSLLGMGCKALPEQREEVRAILRRHGVRLAFENHPGEPTPEVVLEKIGPPGAEFGSAFDTGWWGTHDYPLLEAFATLRDRILLVHLKNVEGPGAHICAPWESGCLDLKPFVGELKRSGYEGWISLEYEPYEGDPRQVCREFLQVATQWWNDAPGA